MNEEQVTWLKAQIDEDERVVWAACMHIDDCNDSGFYERFNNERVLAEIDAKRRILDLHHETEMESEPDHDRLGAGCAECHHFDWPCDTIRLLALPYAGRDGYREEWRP